MGGVRSPLDSEDELTATASQMSTDDQKRNKALSENALSRASIFAVMWLLCLIVTVGEFWVSEGWDAFVSTYVAVITMTTTGYGDLCPAQPPGRALACILTAVSITIMCLWISQVQSYLSIKFRSEIGDSGKSLLELETMTQAKVALVFFVGFIVVFFVAFVAFQIMPTEAIWGRENWLDTLYFMAITIFTVGYGDLYPMTTSARMVTIITSLLGTFFLLACCLALVALNSPDRVWVHWLEVDSLESRRQVRLSETVIQHLVSNGAVSETQVKSLEDQVINKHRQFIRSPKEKGSYTAVKTEEQVEAGTSGSDGGSSSPGLLVSHRLGLIFAAWVLLFVVSSITFSQLEGWDAMMSFYFVAQSVTTLGYGDVTPKNPTSRGLTCVLVISGVIIMTAWVCNVHAWLTDYFKARIREKDALSGIRRSFVEIEQATQYIVALTFSAAIVVWFLVSIIVFHFCYAGSSLKGNNKSIFDTTYFVSQTLLSIGYGDIVPKTGSARFATAICVLGGYFIVMCLPVALCSLLDPNRVWLDVSDLDRWNLKRQKWVADAVVERLVHGGVVTRQEIQQIRGEVAPREGEPAATMATNSKVVSKDRTPNTKAKPKKSAAGKVKGADDDGHESDV